MDRFINRVKAEFAAISENEAFARAFVAAFVAAMDPTIEELTEIKTALSEAVSNCVIHAYEGGNTENTIILECMYDAEGTVVIKISDNGKGIENIEEARKPLFTTGNKEERSGMGFTVMESFADKVLVESEKGGGTKVTLIKSLDVSYGV